MNNANAEVGKEPLPETVTVYNVGGVRIRILCRDDYVKRAIENPQDVNDALMAVNAEEMAKRIATGETDRHLDGIKALCKPT